MSHEVLNSIMLAIGLAVLCWLLIRSRDWHTPAQAARLDEHDKRIAILAGNVNRIGSEQIQFRHDDVEANTRIWEELKAINARLNSMKCPLSDPTCPFDPFAGAE